MHTQEVVITPALACAWLEANVNNRTVTDTKVKEFAGAMQRGEWLVTHQGIGFDVDGNLIDGQHRLWAIVEAQCDVTMMVTHGLDPHAKTVIDTGRKRMASDVLQMAGEKDSIVLAGALRLLHAYHLGVTQRAAVLTHDQTLQLLELNPDLRKVTNHGRQLAKALMMSPSTATAGCYLVYADARYDEWLLGLVEGIGLWEGDPRRALQMAFANAVRLQRLRSSEWQLAMYGKAWLAFRKDRHNQRHLVWRANDPMPHFGKVKHWAKFHGVS